MNSSLKLIANPAARLASERKIKAAVKLLSHSGYSVDLCLTQKRGDAEESAKEAAEKGTAVVVAAGGDGTFNEVANGLACTDTKMAILPMGTTNVLAKELNISENLEGAVKRILDGSVHTVSLGKITLTCHSSLITRYFFMMAGIGFDGSAVYGVDNLIKRFSGKGAYILSGFRTLINYAPEKLAINADGSSYAGYSAIIGNASKYGGNLKVTPAASLFSPELYIYIMHGRRRADIMRYVCGILLGRHLGFKDITCIKAHSIEIKGKALIQIDGDYLGSTPATITAAPDVLKLVF